MGGAAAGAASGSEAAGSMSETMRGGKSGDGDAVAEAEAEAEAELAWETGSGLFSWLVFVVLAMLSTSPCAVASPVVSAGAGAGTIGDGSSTPTEVISMLPSALTADSIGGCEGVNWTEARIKTLVKWESQRSFPPSKRRQASSERLSNPSKRLKPCAQKPAFPIPKSWFLSSSAKSAKGFSSGNL